MARRHRPAQMKPHVQIATMKMLGAFFYLMGLGCGVTALSLTFLLWQGQPVGLPCPVTSRDGILRVDDGFGGARAYLINGGDSFLIATGGRHPSGPVGMTILSGLPSGALLHVEFCGSHTVRLISNGHEVFELTQKRAEDNVRSGMKSTGRFALISFAAALFGWLLARRARD